MKKKQEKGSRCSVYNLYRKLVFYKTHCARGSKRCPPGAHSYPSDFQGPRGYIRAVATSTEVRSPGTRRPLSAHAVPARAGTGSPDSDPDR